MAEQAVRLVLLGDASAAPVCEGDVCYLPGATAEVSGVAVEGEQPEAATEPADPATQLS